MRHWLTPLLTLAAIATLLGGCGFQLRGNIDLPAGVEPYVITGVGSTSPLGIELHNILSAHGVELTDNEKQANYKLVILKHTQDKRSSAIGAGAHIIEYQLIETVEFEVRNKANQISFGPRKLVERKALANDLNKVVSANKEEHILRKEMRQRLVAKIARQIRIFDYTSDYTSQPTSHPISHPTSHPASQPTTDL